MGVTASDLTKLYLAYFGRPPDFDGVQFYVAPTYSSLPGVGSDTIRLPEAMPEVIMPIQHQAQVHRPVEHWRHKRKRGSP